MEENISINNMFIITMKLVKCNIEYGFNNENRFIYDTTNPNKPQFYDDKSNIHNGVRFDVIQVRPND